MRGPLMRAHALKRFITPISPSSYRSHKSQYRPCWRRYFWRWCRHSLESLTKRQETDVHLDSLSSVSISLKNGISLWARFFSRLCHPSTSLFVQKLCPKTDHLSGDHVRLSRQVASMYFASSIGSDVVCFLVSTTIRLCDPGIFFSSGSEW